MKTATQTLRVLQLVVATGVIIASTRYITDGDYHGFMNAVLLIGMWLFLSTMVGIIKHVDFCQSPDTYRWQTITYSRDIHDGDTVTATLKGEDAIRFASSNRAFSTRSPKDYR